MRTWPDGMRLAGQMQFRFELTHSSCHRTFVHYVCLLLSLYGFFFHMHTEIFIRVLAYFTIY